jgi:light-harvesting complex 1 beta chain
MAEPTKAEAGKAGVTPSLSGLTDDEAREFHDQFKITFTAFMAVAAVAHLLVYAAKPWF